MALLSLLSILSYNTEGTDHDHLLTHIAAGLATLCKSPVLDRRKENAMRGNVRNVHHGNEGKCEGCPIWHGGNARVVYYGMMESMRVAYYGAEGHMRVVHHCLRGSARVVHCGMRGSINGTGRLG